MKKSRFTATYHDGTKHSWRFWRDPRKPAVWMLETHDGTVRTLEPTWNDSAPVIRAILENYGMTAEIN